MTNGMLASWSDAFVSLAGVGAAASPTTVSAGASQHLTSPRTMNSASPAGVYSVRSADGPAPEIPSISEVSVVPIVSKNTASSSAS